MFEDPSEKSLVQILDDRHDTVFDGYHVEESNADAFPNDELYQDELGNYYYHDYDYIATKEVEGEAVGVLVADEDGKNCMPHDNSNFPHLIGLYVREDHRTEGIGSELVHEFMDMVEEDTCVVDCEMDVVPFYMQLDCEVLYLGQVKRGQDPSQPPLIEIDVSETPDHGLPVLEPETGEHEEFLQDCKQEGEPAVYVAVEERVARGRVPDSHDLAGEGNIRRYASRKSQHELCSVVVTTGHLSEGLTVEAVEELQQVPVRCVEHYNNTGKRAWIRTRDGTGTINTWPLSPVEAKEIADEAYSIVANN